MTSLTTTSPAVRHPIAPTTTAEAGLTEELVAELVLKTLHGTSGLSGSDLAKRIGLNFGIVEPALESLKAQHHCEIVGGTTLGASAFRYRLSDAGHAQAMRALKRSRYAGAAPVPIGQYLEYMQEFWRIAASPVTADQVRTAFAHLVVSDRVIDEVGPAVNSGQAIFLYGPAGNGKTIMARAIRSLLPGTMSIPHALEVGGNIIRFFDPTVHEPVDQPEDRSGRVRYDRRWIHCRRPMVAVGGELTLDALSLVYNPRTGVYRAPVQALANGGVFLVDEFGRQRCPPRDLLNWWMVPLESRVEYLTLQSGEKVEMPFLPLVIFATNLKPSELVDEAFLRRIQYKIYAESPTAEGFIRIFERCCTERKIPFDESLAIGLLGGFLRQRRIQLRACQPRDLIDQALSLASYRGLPRILNAELLESACLSYFIEERQTPRGPA